jgi:hypothetical protein
MIGSSESGRGMEKMKEIPEILVPATRSEEEE